VVAPSNTVWIMLHDDPHTHVEVPRREAHYWKRALGSRVIELRRQGWTIERIARLCDRTSAAVQHWENSERRYRSWEARGEYQEWMEENGIGGGPRP
jgi:Putative ATPase subunit of terminase (gpP-like)